MPQHGVTKAGDPLLREAMFRAADGARKSDPQLAATYQRLRHAGKHHNSALCHLATRLVTGIASCLRNGQPYTLRDVDGQPVTTERGKQIVAERYKIDPAITTSTRRKAQVLKGRDRPGATGVAQRSSIPA